MIGISFDAKQTLLTTQPITWTRYGNFPWKAIHKNYDYKSTLPGN